MVKNRTKKVKQVMNDSLLWILENYREQRINTIVLSILSVALSLCTVSESLTLKNIINSAVDKNDNEFATSIFMMIVLIVFRLFLRSFTRWLNERTKAKLENTLKERLFRALLTKDYASVTAVHSGEWMNRLSGDAVVVTENAVDIVPNALATIAEIVVSVVLIIGLVSDFPWVILPLAITLIIVAVLMRGQLKKLHKRVQESDGKLRVFIADCLSTLMIIRVFSREEASAEKADDYMKKHMDRRMERVRFSNVVNVGYQFILEFIYVIAVFSCGHSILNRTMDYGSFTAVITLAGRILGPITSMSGYVTKWYAMQASAERLMEAERFAEDYENGKRNKKEVLAFYENSFKGLSLRNARFSYIPTDEKTDGLERKIVISDMNMDIDKGDVFAITGPSGCGKSTILRIFMSFFPLDSGEKLIRTNSTVSEYNIANDASGDGTIPLDSSWRGLFAYVPQGNQLMSGRIRDVLTFGERDISDTDISDALDIACASGFIAELPEGLDTVLGERGSGLSEGQLQRIAIARAILSGQPILLLDEATSSLDEATEADLLQKLRSLTDRTVIIVTHRLKALSICNKELHMEESGIV